MGPKVTPAPVSMSTSFDPVLTRNPFTDSSIVSPRNERASAASSSFGARPVMTSLTFKGNVPSLNAVISTSPSIIR